MVSKFMNVEPQKQERIINAALEEFAQKGYKNASTNEIVKRANISKGLLFHYFGSKKDLFLYLYNYSIDIFLNEFYSKIDFNETDIIKRLRQLSMLKIKIIQKHPNIYNFMLTSALDDSIEVKPEIESKYKNITQNSMKKLLDGIDTSLLKNGVNIQRACEIIIWVSEGFSKNILDRMKQDQDYRTHFDIHEIIDKFDEYMNILKNALYK